MLALSEDAFYEEIGDRIRQFRLQKNIKQETFSDLLELTRGSVVNMEKGRQRPSIYQLIKISHILNVDYIDLIPVDLNITKLPKPSPVVEEINFDEVVSTSVNLNQNVKSSVNDFISQLKFK